MIKIRKRKYIINISILIIIILIFILFVQNKKIKSYDDILFLKLLGNYNNIAQNSKSKNNPEKNKDISFEFNVTYKNTKLKTVNLLETVNENTNVYEKIAPGTNGNFSIILKANKESEYKVEFESYNSKPANLKFKAFCDGKVISEEKDSLEDLATDLKGVLQKNEIKVIIVNWYWNYENNQSENSDKQDTKDSQTIGQYRFGICAYGNEMEG